MQSQQLIPLNRLVPSLDNVRRTDRLAGIEALMASIGAHGLRQNLNVVPTTEGRFAVVAGGRRLIALKKLARAGVVAVDMPVPCRVLAEGENPTEISLVENAMRHAMHPDDQFTAFRALVDEGMSEQDVAARFGVTPAVVAQRLRLARVSPVIRAAYRQGRLTLDQVMAYAVSDDQAAQEGAWVSLGEDGGAHAIRHALTAESVTATSRLAVFVGVDAYLAAGGGMLRDLFDEGRGYLTDRALLTALAHQRLDEAVAAVKAEGWGWVKAELEPDYATSYGRVPAMSDRDGVPTYQPEAMREAGAVLRVEYDGNLSVRRGLVVRHEQDSRSEAVLAPKARPDYPASVVQELTAHRTAALQLALSRRPDVALVAVVHALTLPVLFPLPYGRHELALGLSGARCQLKAMMPNPAEGPAVAALAEVVEGWGERLPGTADDLWAWCLAQPHDTLLELLAVVAGVTIDAVQRRDDRDGSARLSDADRLAVALDLDMREAWQPTAAGFFSRVSKASMAKALTEAGKPGIAADIMMIKKAAAAIHTAEALAGTGWLPQPLRAGVVAANDNGADETTDREDEAA